ncbi:MAG: CBS domain-containing protein [Oligoflexia bacterium]|nr:CBS domain-containing protein [Oligoflexia bacterium]
MTTGDDTNRDKISSVIRYACERKFGALDNSFLCQSLSILDPVRPVCISEHETIDGTVELLKGKRMGCLLVTNAAGKLVGIFSERDLLLKVNLRDPKSFDRPVSDFMTKDPVTAAMDMTLAFALNMMSEGGFRHLPIVDQDLMPVGIVSVKDVVDYLVKDFVNEILSFELPEPL